MLDNSIIVESYDRKARLGSQAMNGHLTKKRKYTQVASGNEGERFES